MMRTLNICTGAALVLLTVASHSRGQITGQFLVTAQDIHGNYITDLSADDLRLQRNGDRTTILDVVVRPSAVQAVVIFEGLAATQRQLNAALAAFIGELHIESVVDMQSVEGELDTAIIQAIDDLHGRDVARPVIVMLGQASEMARSDLQSSQVRGRRRAADLPGDLDGMQQQLADHGISFYGTSVTEVTLERLQGLARASGGRFAVIDNPDDLANTLVTLAQEISSQLLVTYQDDREYGAMPELILTRPELQVHAVPFSPMH